MKEDLLSGGLLCFVEMDYFHGPIKPTCMKSIRLSFLLVLFFCTHVSQAVNQDSLEVRKLFEKAFSVLYSKPDEAKVLANQALLRSRELGICLLEAESQNLVGIVYDVTAKYDSALMVYDKIIKLSDKCGLEVMKGQVYNNIGLIYWNTGELDKAIDYYTRSLKIFEEHEKKKGVSSTLSNIGLLYTEKNEYEESERYHQRALEIRREIKDWYGVSVSYVNLANIYMARDQLDSAKSFLLTSVKIKDTLNDRRGLAINYNNLGIIAFNQDKNDSAIAYLRKGIQIRRELGEKNLEASDHYSLGYFYMDWKEYDKAYLQLDTAMMLAQESQSKSLVGKIYKRYARIDTLVGDYQSAVRNLTKYYEIETELSGLEKQKAFDEIQTRYESEKKERELAENKVELAEQELKLRQRTIWAAVLLAILAVLVLSGIYVYRQQKLKQRQLAEEARLKEQLAKAEVNSKVQEERVRISRDLHDHIGSQLTVISSAIDNIAFTESDEAKRQKLLDISDNGRATMVQLRDTIWAMNQKVIDLETLVAKTREFTSRLNLNGNVTVNLKADEEADLSPALAINLYRIVQEATNNAVKYAEFSKLEVDFEKRNGTLAIQVADDGKGFDLDNNAEKGFGLINMKERLKEFSGGLEIKTKPGDGTKVKVTVPLNQANYV